MIIQSLVIPKESLITITTHYNLQEALHIMEENKLRCIPVLDESNTLYRGNIYRYHIYQHCFNGGSLNDSVTNLLKNATKYILDTDSFFKLFFTLSDLPYISVLNKQHHFIGTIRHNDVENMLAQAWQLKESSYVLTIELPEKVSTFEKIIKIVRRYTDMTAILTFDREDYSLRKRVVIGLPHTIEKNTLNKLVDKLISKQFHVIEIEDLTTGI